MRTKLAEQAIDKIVKDILAQDKDKLIKTIVLTGSFSRNETCIADFGDWKYVLSDYDFLIISEKPFQTNRSMDYWRNLLDEAFSYVEIFFVEPNLVFEDGTKDVVLNKMFGKLLYGDKKMFNKMFSKVGSEVHKEHIESLLKTQILNLDRGRVLMFEGNFLRACYQLITVIEGLCFLTLFENKMFIPLYLERYKGLKKVLDRNHSLLELYRFAMDFRAEPEKHYLKIREIYPAVKKELEASVKKHISNGSTGIVP
ncbi:MAG: hypothetical protein GOU99_01600 [Candidatus Altiarchaeota archaeon]|nr:hypothetical protein [Candidatus Altiarchaeota archaeon]